MSRSVRRVRAPRRRASRARRARRSTRSRGVVTGGPCRRHRRRTAPGAWLRPWRGSSRRRAATASDWAIDVAPGESDRVAVRTAVHRDPPEAPRMRPAAIRDERDDPRSVGVPGRSRPRVDHPAGQVRVRPVPDRPVQVRGDGDGGRRAVRRTRRTASATGRRRSPGRPRPRPRSTGRRASTRAGSRDPRAPGSRAAVTGPPSPSTSDLPDRRPRPPVGVGAWIGHEGDRPAVRPPGEPGDAARDIGHLARRGAVLGRHDEGLRALVAGSRPRPSDSRGP